MTKRRFSTSTQARSWPDILAALMGVWLGLALLKFGDPVVLDWMVTPPANLQEFLAISWPVSWANGLFAILIGVGLVAGWPWPKLSPWLVWLPLVWLGWELLASIWTVDWRLTAVTVKHFAVCTGCFYVGFLLLGRAVRPRWFWGGLFVGFLVVLWIGFGQHYGGLEATRKLFYEQPNWRVFPPEYLKRLARDRIFSTLVYPNALAGVILLLLPPMVVGLWNLCRRWTFMSRSVAVGLLAYAGLACLVWSGSKAGWLIALVLAGVTVSRLPLERRVKVGLVVVGLVVGGTSFVLRHAGYFERGATSVAARFDYWRAALTIVGRHPLVGTGPGTFSTAYRVIKPPQAEMAHLTHNDYLEQASDSGIPGFLAYSCLWIGSLLYLYRKSRLGFDWFRFAVLLGLLGWGLQAFVEFSLYIPGSAWAAFTLLGSQLGLGGMASLNPEANRNPVKFWRWFRFSRFPLRGLDRRDAREQA